MKKHSPYYRIRAYQILMQVTDQQICDRLHITTRTLQNKKQGRSDFTQKEGLILSEMLGMSQQELFDTEDGP